jgi:hypothetical protein
MGLLTKLGRGIAHAFGLVTKGELAEQAARKVVRVKAKIEAAKITEAAIARREIAEEARVIWRAEKLVKDMGLLERGGHFVSEKGLSYVCEVEFLDKVGGVVIRTQPVTVSTNKRLTDSEIKQKARKLCEDSPYYLGDVRIVKRSIDPRFAAKSQITAWQEANR